MKTIFRKKISSFEIILLLEDIRNKYFVYFVMKEKDKLRKKVKRDFKKLKYALFGVEL